MTAKIAIASGGTGGHFYPTLAIARELERRAATVDLLVAGRHAAEQLGLASRNGLRASEVRAFRLPRGPWSALCFPWRFVAAVQAARRRLGELRPDLLLGMGSYFELWDKTSYDAQEAKAMQGDMPDVFKDFSF